MQAATRMAKKKFKNFSLLGKKTYFYEKLVFYKVSPFLKETPETSFFLFATFAPVTQYFIKKCKNFLLLLKLLKFFIFRKNLFC